MNIARRIASFMITLLEVGLGFEFYHMLTKERNHERWKWLVEAAGIFLITCVWKFNGNVGFVSTQIMFLNTMEGLLILLLLGNKKNIVAATGILFVYMTSEEFLKVLYGIFFFWNNRRERYFQDIYFGKNHMWEMLLNIMTFLCLFILYLICKWKKDKINIYKVRWIMCIFGIVEWRIMTYALQLLLGLSADDRQWNTNIILIICASTIICFIISIIYMLVKAKKKVIELENELLEKNYKETKKMLESSMITFHDWKNHLLILDSYANNGDVNHIREYLAEIGNSIKILNQYIWCDNEVINLIINTKIVEMEEKNICVSVQVDNIDCELSDYDLCIILSNLIDNAIEACEKIMTGERHISIKIHQEGEIVVMKVENKVENCQSIKISEFKSNKKGIHGYGLKSVKNSVEKYGGVMHVSCENDVFRVTVTFF